MPASDDDDDRPRKRPWSKKDRDEDEDDRPKRKRRGDDDEEDRPRSRRRDDDEDEDDRPKRKRYADDDDDYDHDRPKRKGAKGSNGLAVAGLILGLLSFCTVGLTAIPGGICALLALGKPTGRGMAIGGLVASVFGALAWIVGAYGIYTVAGPARERVKDANNMKMIGLAFHNQHDQRMGMTGPYATDERGAVNKGLSFRVGLLPYLEQDSLHRQFDMSQAWNSAKNQSASNTKVPVFTAAHLKEPSASTPYRVFYGGGAIFEEDGKPVSLMRISDGTSNTILMVYASEQVPWAEPKEFRYSDTTPLPKLGPPDGKGGMALFADGSVRFLAPTVSESTLRLAIKKADGMPLPADW